MQVQDKFDNRAKAAEMHIPCLVIHGSLDEIVPQGQVLTKRKKN